MADVPCDSVGKPLCKAPAQGSQRIQPAVASCPSGWTFYNNHCYYIGSNKVTQYQADAYCGSLGSYLAEVTSSSELNWLTSFANARVNADVWVISKLNSIFNNTNVFINLLVRNDFAFRL